MATKPTEFMSQDEHGGNVYTIVVTLEEGYILEEFLHEMDFVRVVPRKSFKGLCLELKAIQVIELRAYFECVSDSLTATELAIMEKLMKRVRGLITAATNEIRFLEELEEPIF